MTRSKILVTIIIVLIIVDDNSKPKLTRVPDWAQDAVWYQIFPERFRDGDNTNNPAQKDIIEGWPHEVTSGWKIHPWTSDWYKLQQWEQNEHDFYWNAGLRRYGGDIQGVIDKLGYLENLGITAIYFNPVFESPSLHKYDATFFHHIDNNFGPDPEEDKKIWEQEIHSDPTTWRWTTADKLFLTLLNEAHKRDIKVIIDGVFNHVGNTFWAFKDVVKNQEKSNYKNWFIIKKWDDAATEKNEFDYIGWNGVKDLPEFNEDENGLTEAVANHVHDIVKRWMDPNQDGDPSDGIDGWRLDVAEKVKPAFWRKFRTWVNAINPEAYITGEIWWEDWQNNKMMNAAPWLNGDQFDAVMNYRFTLAVKQFVSDQKYRITVKAFADSINSISKDYNKENLYAMMNLLDSHDSERLASLIVNPDYWYDHNANPAQRESFNVRKPNLIERMKQKIMVGIQMTMPGAPMFYYGDETGMWGGDDPDCRKPMVWSDLKYETETTHPFGKQRPADDVSFDSGLFDWYQLLISIRKNNIELSRGTLVFEDLKDNDVLGFIIEYNVSSIFVVINNSSFLKEINLQNFKRDFTNLVNGEKHSILAPDAGVKLGPYEIAIFK